jgi:hypothetical protein
LHQRQPGYDSLVHVLAAIYLVGALFALWRTDAAVPTKVALAALWPLGPIAFVLTVALLLGASLVAFPLVAGAIAAVAAGVAWAFLR